MKADYVYRVAGRQRRRAMATPIQPAGRFWLVYFSIFVVGVTAGLALWAQ